MLPSSQVRRRPMPSPRSRRLRDLGRKDASRLFDESSCVNPASHIPGEDISLEVDLVYTDMEIKGAGRDIHDLPIKQSKLIQLVQEEQTKRNKPTILLLEGLAGMGKTMFLKLLMSYWKYGRECVLKLLDFDLLVSMECRNPTIKTLGELLSYQWPTARAEFDQVDDMVHNLLTLKSLILCDGLDEVNPSSKQLFDDILHRMNTNMIMVCTTRPEKVGDYYRMVSNSNVTTFHVKIHGVPERSMHSFITRYHEALRQKGKSHQGTDGLLCFFKTMRVHLADHWRIPLNLSLLTVLWAVDCEKMNLVTTATELYDQMQKIIEEKLMVRIVSNSSHTDHAALRKNIQNFIDELCKEALIGLRDNAIILKQDAVQRLKICCTRNRIPEREALGAFLVLENTWRSTDLEDLQYGYAHKGQQEFYASRYIYARVVTIDSVDASFDVKSRVKEFLHDLAMKSKVSDSNCKEIEKQVENVLRFSDQGSSTATCIPNVIRRFPNMFRSSFRKAIKSLPPWIPQNRDRKGSTEESTSASKIMDILKETENTDAFHLNKYRNTLVILLGLFYQAECEVDMTLVEELVELLQMSGVDDRPEWIRVLNGVKCNDTVARLIGQFPNMMEGTAEINDFNIYAYATLLREHQPQSVKITVQGNPSGVARLEELLQSIANHRCKVEDLGMEYSFRHPTTNASFLECLKHVLDRCVVEAYAGPVVLGMRFSPTVKSLRLSVTDFDSCIALAHVLSSVTQLQVLRVCVSLDTDVEALTPLPGAYPVHLYIPDIENGSDIINAGRIAKRLQPTEGAKSFWNIFLPRAMLATHQIEEDLLLQGMKGVKVEHQVLLPKSCQPSSADDDQRLQEISQQTLHCHIKWSDAIDDW